MGSFYIDDFMDLNWGLLLIEGIGSWFGAFGCGIIGFNGVH